MGEAHLPVLETVVRHQQPARQSLFDGAACVRERRMADLDEERMSIARQQVLQLFRGIEIRKALRKIDGPQLTGTIGHHREDGGADVGEFGVDVHVMG